MSSNIFEYHKPGVPTPHGVILSVELRERDPIGKQGIVDKTYGPNAWLNNVIIK